MKGPNYSVHNFACPDCKLNCQLIQDGRRASVRHQNPICNTYRETRPGKVGGGQKFLELAFIAPSEENDRILVAFRNGERDELVEAPAETGSGDEEVADQDRKAHRTPEAALADAVKNWPAGEPSTRYEPTQKLPSRPNPPRWQPLYEQLASELRAVVYERGEHSKGLAQAMASAEPGQVLVGFDDTKIAGLATAIANLCSASKGHP